MRPGRIVTYRDSASMRKRATRFRTKRKSSSRLASKVPPHAGTAEPAAPPFAQAAEGMRRVARILPATEDRHRARP